MKQESPAVNTPPAQDEWETFLANAVGGLQRASDELKKKRGKYEEKIDWFRSKTSGIPRENSVTRALAEEFRAIKAKQSISGSGVQVMDLRHIEIECERPRPHDPGISDKSKPTDMAFSMFKDNVLDLRVEAKTVVSDSDLKIYTGRDGLMRFEDGSNPYTVAPFGGMVAYVVDEDAAAWSKKISAMVSSTVGDERTYMRKVGGADHHVSKHSFQHTSNEGTADYSVDVIHMAIEIDAKPPRRT